MKKSLLILAFAFTCSITSTSALAQEIDLPELRDSISIFTGVLEDALELSQSSGLFGMSLGGVNATYLYRQGVIIEVRTPLANQRSRLSLASLNSAMQSLQAGSNPFERMVRRASPPPVLPDETDNREANGFYQEMMERIAKIDYSLVVSSAIQQASDSARSLRALGNVDDSGYEDLRIEMESLRERLQSNIDQLSLIEEELRATGGTEQAISNSTESDFSARLDELLEQLEPLREQAIARAAELKEQTELAEQRYVERWHEDVSEFEQKLYAALCNYGASLRALPDDESISVILKGLGEDSTNANRRPDKVHVLSKSDVQLCQRGEIDVAALRQRSAQYSY